MILCCGEALIDMIPLPTPNGPDGFVPHCGGAVYNSAIALGRLGAPVGMLTGLSRDMFGQMLTQGLAASAVDLSRIITSDRPTTLAFVKLEDGHASYDFYDENSAGRMLMPTDMPKLGPDVTALYFGGISIACEPCADAYAALMKAEASGRAVMLDPNIRPGFIRDETRYRERLARMLALADIVKVSDEDLHWIQPGPGDLAAKAATVQEKGPALVIVTRGGAGAVGFRAGQNAPVEVPAQAAKVVDTVGAGDTFNAGILARLAELGLLYKPALRALSAEALAEVLRFGARVAAITVSRAGANPPWAAELSGTDG